MPHRERERERDLYHTKETPTTPRHKPLYTVYHCCYSCCKRPKQSAGETSKFFLTNTVEQANEREREEKRANTHFVLYPNQRRHYQCTLYCTTIIISLKRTAEIHGKVCDITNHNHHHHHPLIQHKRASTIQTHPSVCVLLKQGGGGGKNKPIRSGKYYTRFGPTHTHTHNCTGKQIHYT